MLAIRARGQAPPQIAWERYIDPRCWPQWSPQIRRVDGPRQPVLPGDQGTVVGPAGLRVDFTILEVDPGERRWSWRVAILAGRLTLDHGIDPAGAGSTAWVRIHGPAPVVAPYAPFAWLALRRLVSA